MNIIWGIVESLALAALLPLSGWRLLHYFQLESYQLPGFYRSLKRNAKKALLPGLAMAAVGVLSLVIGLPGIVRIALIGVMAALLFMQAKKEKLKKPFVITERVKRLIAMHALTAFAVALVVRFALPMMLWALLPAFEAALLALGAVCAQPIEKHINQQFVDDAKKRLESNPSLIKIGITGSYGKTSTKFLLRDILSVKYNVLATPSSFNTTMGVTRVIREQLMPSHQVFIAEMGARHVGDIKELVDLVHPTMGLLTSVGPQHLDTFGTIERIKNTKYELIDGLPQNGTAILARDGAICEELYHRCPLEKKYMPGDLMTASDMEWGPFGTRFTLTDVETGESARCETRLLGEHSIANLLLCCTAARTLGMTPAEIAMGVARCQPVEHRLELLNGSGGVSIIDDAFNANPVGAKAALRVLKNFPGRRIIITPGMVELGGEEAQFNREFGEQMAESVDVAILVGKRHTQPIVDGLLAQGFPQEKIHVVSSLEESTKVLHAMMQAGDVVLYENDLPDNYSE
ncbi:MAG: UDP-N-acetylmuramoyl-tripeptide--D-alanyl-D-alanine ligase [Clostridiales bacterium]|nr:UDP-N-acetylmuramoyl-tripeptide--D-alanyl-D-alanine ligase [Clostridiales bacterium]